jgi:hypothetical protein
MVISLKHTKRSTIPMAFLVTWDDHERSCSIFFCFPFLAAALIYCNVQTSSQPHLSICSWQGKECLMHLGWGKSWLDISLLLILRSIELWDGRLEDILEIPLPLYLLNKWRSLERRQSELL